MDTIGRSDMIITSGSERVKKVGEERKERRGTLSSKLLVWYMTKGVGAFLGVGAYWSMGTFLKKFGMLSSL